MSRDLSLESPLPSAVAGNDRSADEFTLSAYCEVIQSLRGRGYQIVTYEQLDPAQSHLVLRHDVDFDLDAAVEMAAYQSENGFSASYFVMVRTEFYNVFGRRGAEALRSIRQLGHRVGLHFDASLYAARTTDFPDAIDHECKLLEWATGGAVEIVTFHRPASGMIDYQFDIPGRINEFSWRGEYNMGYCSDSRGSWHYGHPLDNPAVAEGRALELLTHPIWWTTSGATPSAKLTSFLERRYGFLDQEIEANCRVYERAVQNKT